jgi:transposase-like protein
MGESAIDTMARLTKAVNRHINVKITCPQCGSENVVKEQYYINTLKVMFPNKPVEESENQDPDQTNFSCSSCKKDFKVRIKVEYH